MLQFIVITLILQINDSYQHQNLTLQSDFNLILTATLSSFKSITKFSYCVEYLDQDWACVYSIGFKKDQPWPQVIYFLSILYDLVYK